MTFDTKQAQDLIAAFNDARVSTLVVAGELPNAINRIQELEMAFSDLVDDICGLQPVGDENDAIRAISQHDLKQRQEIDQLRAECERMRPVFEAAVKWNEAECAVDAAIESARMKRWPLDPMPPAAPHRLYQEQTAALNALRAAISSTLTPADGSGR